MRSLKAVILLMPYWSYITLSQIKTSNLLSQIESYKTAICHCKPQQQQGVGEAFTKSSGGLRAG